MRKRFYRDRAVAECGLCGREIWPGEGFYQVNGEIFCRDCLERYVFTGCRAFRRTVPGLLFSETEPEDLDTRMEDHVADESRYLCMARPIPPRRVETALPVQDDPLNMLVRR